MARSGRRRATCAAVVAAALLAPASAGAVSPPGEGRLTPIPPPGGCWSELATPGCFDANELKHAADVVVSADNRFAYVASYDSSSVTGFRLDPHTGGIKERVACFSKTLAFGCKQGNGLDGARGLALAPNGKTLYVASAFHVSDDGAVAAFARDPATGGLPSERNCVSAKGTGGCSQEPGLQVAQNVALSEDGKRVYVSAYSGGPSQGAITVFGTSPNGSVGAETWCATGTIGGAPGCQESSTILHPIGIAVSGRELFFTSLADGGAVLSYHLRADGTLEFPDKCIAETASGTLCLTDGDGLQGANGLVLSGDGRSVYVSSGEAGGAIASFSRKPSGQLDAQLNCVDVTGNQHCRRGHGITGALGVGIAPDGKNVYLGSGDGLATFSIDPVTGELDNEIQCFKAAADANCAAAAGVSHATGIAVTGDNRAVYVAAQMTGGSGAFSVFRRELAPVCKPLSRTVVSGTAVKLAPACTDPNGDALSRAYSLPARGSLTGAPGAAVVYRSAPGYLGPDSFTVRASDGILDSSPAKVSLTVKRDAPPSSRIGALAAKMPAAKLKRFTGTASDDAGLKRVDVAVTAPSGKACLRLAKGGNLKPGDCKKPVWLRAKGTAKWRFALKKPLPKGRYVVRSRATDSAGHRERRFTAARGNRRAFRADRRVEHVRRATPNPAAALRAPALRRLKQPDQVPLRIGELPQRDALHDRLGAHRAPAAEALGLGERLLDVGHLDVEGHVAPVAVGPLPDPAGDPDAVGGYVVLALDEAVVHRIVGVGLPAEQLRVVAPELRAVLPDHLEMHDRLSHLVSSLRARCRSQRPARARKLIGQQARATVPRISTQLWRELFV
jgi:6-phosphogluconolactonase (cycloisomerase 2 family)